VLADALHNPACDQVSISRLLMTRGLAAIFGTVCLAPARPALASQRAPSNIPVRPPPASKSASP
jgi:hypothetical protein